MTPTYRVFTEDNGKGWSWILGPGGYREGPIRYRWEAQEWADEMNAGKPPPDYMQHRSYACETCRDDAVDARKYRCAIVQNYSATHFARLAFVEDSPMQT